MSGHNHHHEQYNSANAGTSSLNDPLNAGTLDLQGKSGAIVSTPEATNSLILPEAPIGVTVYCHCQAGTCSVADQTAAIITVSEDAVAHCVSIGSGEWVAILLDDVVATL